MLGRLGEVRDAFELKKEIYQTTDQGLAQTVPGLGQS